MTPSVSNSTRTTAELLTTTLQWTVTTDAQDVQTFDVNKRLVTAFVAVIIYWVIVGAVFLTCRLYNRRQRPKRSGALSIAEYCNRSYNSASTSDVHDVIFSVHFSSATGDVRLPTSLNADDRQRLDADFNAADDDPDVCPYATFSELEQMQAATIGARREPDAAATTTAAGKRRPAQNGTDSAAVEGRRLRPRRTGKTTDRGDAHHRLEAPRRPGSSGTDNDLHALYAQPHKLIRRDSDNQRAQSET